MIDALLLFILVACAVGVAFPFVFYPLTLRLMPAVELAPRRGRRPTMTLMFCTFNEASSLREKIANIADLRVCYPDLEVLVYDDGSDDGSVAKLEERSDLLTVVRGAGRRGKAHGMKTLVARASGDILVFTDANVEITTESIERLGAYYADDTIGGVAGSLIYYSDEQSATAEVGSLYWRLEEKLKDLESRCGNVMGADGSIFSIRRNLYPTFPDTTLDDMTVSMAVVFAGKRFIKVTDVIATERIVASRAKEYRRKIRIAARAFHTYLYLRPELRAMSPLDRYKYAAHKLIRWFGGAFLIVGALAASVLAWRMSPWLFLALAVMAFVAGLAGSRARSGPLAAIFDIVIAYFATLHGISLAMRGKTMATWNKAR